MVHFENNNWMSLDRLDPLTQTLAQETKHGTGKIICVPQNYQNTLTLFSLILLLYGNYIF